MKIVRSFILHGRAYDEGERVDFEVRDAVRWIQQRFAEVDFPAVDPFRALKRIDTLMQSPSEATRNGATTIRALEGKRILSAALKNTQEKLDRMVARQKLIDEVRAS